MKTNLQKELDSNIPESVIATRQGGNGRTLDYLETWYVIDRLNQVLGQGNWAYSSEVNCVHNGTVETKSGATYSVHYTARVRLVVTVDETSTEFTDYGYGDGTDKNNPGKAHELAVKEAVSDGLKRCAKNLGRSMGLALYDKTQEYVGTANTNRVAVETPKQEVSKISQPSSERVKPTKELIKATYEVLKAQGKITKESFKEKYQQGKALSDLTPVELDVILKTVKQDFNL